MYVWDAEKGDLLQRLHGHSGVVYHAVPHARQAMWASCSDDCTVKTWMFDSKTPIESLDNI